MKRLNIFIYLFSFIIIISSCSSDDECTIDDWVGTYISEATCIASATIDGVFMDSTLVIPNNEVTIIKIDEQTIIMNDGGEDNPELAVFGCQISLDTTIMSNTFTSITKATYELSGNRITGTAEFDFNELNLVCDYIFTRQN